MSAPQNPDEPRNDVADEPRDAAAGDVEKVDLSKDDVTETASAPPADAVYYSDRVAYPAQGFPAGGEQAAADYLTKPQSGYLQQSHDSYLAQWQKDGTSQTAPPPSAAPSAQPTPEPPAPAPGYPAPGYPAQSAGYPAQSAGYGAQSAGYPAQSAGYPAQSAGYPAPNPYAAAYGSAYGAPGYPAYPVRPSMNGLSVAALCVGIGGLLLTFCFIVSGFVTGLAAILLGVFGLKQVNAEPTPHGSSKGMAIGGIVLGAIQLVIAMLLVLAIAADAIN